MDKPAVYGAPFSVYVQAVRLTLTEKGVSYELIHVDPFQSGGAGVEHRCRHPFGLIPAFEDGRIRLYEADAIARYVDDTYPGRPLMPLQPENRARANQLLSILRAYAYPTWVRALHIEAVSKPRRGKPANNVAIETALPTARIALAEIARLKNEAGGPFLVGGATTLPDLFCAPMFACLVDAPEGEALLNAEPAMRTWWQRMSSQASVRALVV